MANQGKELSAGASEDASVLSAKARPRSGGTVACERATTNEAARSGLSCHSGARRSYLT